MMIAREADTQIATRADDLELAAAASQDPAVQIAQQDFTFSEAHVLDGAKQFSNELSHLIAFAVAGSNLQVLLYTCVGQQVRQAGI
ncbi:hypothetical protein [Hyphomicrobium methylovorum]|uniref:hypothetical protein n=1 Tax=Hyphomicrobium methylovorum TaxID=84 RepID=UPI0015E6874C|nr:hypothetical protein [Hyphomicrobium methylovorum]